MRVVLSLLTTGENKTFTSLKECCQHLSIPENALQLDFHHPKFKDGIFQRFRYSWYEVTVYETLENCIAKPIKAIALDRCYGFEYELRN